MGSPFVRDKLRHQINAVDSSRKGSIDQPIKDMVDCINSLPNYYTTSSCSGRVIIVSKDEGRDHQKKGTKWLFVSHELIECGSVVTKSLLDDNQSATFKFEPFILHVCCNNLDSGLNLYRMAFDAGFRNSGLSISKSGRVMVAVRSTHSLDVPLSSNGQVLVSDEYIEFLIKKANEKLLENTKRIERFYLNIKKQLLLPVMHN